MEAAPEARAQYHPLIRMLLLVESFWAFGSVLAALIGFVVIPTLGWQVAFLIGALPAFFVFALRRGMPESPRFLIARRRYNDAELIKISNLEDY